MNIYTVRKNKCMICVWLAIYPKRMRCVLWSHWFCSEICLEFADQEVCLSCGGKWNCHVFPHLSGMGDASFGWLRTLDTLRRDRSRGSPWCSSVEYTDLYKVYWEDGRFIETGSEPKEMRLRLCDDIEAVNAVWKRLCRHRIYHTLTSRKEMVPVQFVSGVIEKVLDRWSVLHSVEVSVIHPEMTEKKQVV